MDVVFKLMDFEFRLRQTPELPARAPPALSGGEICCPLCTPAGSSEELHQKGRRWPAAGASLGRPPSFCVTRYERVC